MSDWTTIECLGRKLLERTCAYATELERWLEDRSELASAIDQEWALRDIAFTRSTNDPAREQARLAWMRDIWPRWRQLNQELDAAYLASPHRDALGERYRVFTRVVTNRHALYCDDNLPLAVTAGELRQAYEKRRGAMTITYAGREYTPEQAATFLESADRSVRQTVWNLLAERSLAEGDAFDEIFDHTLALRKRMAENAGFDSFRDFAFRGLQRFDYGPEECFEFHRAVEAHFVPLAARLAREKRLRMGLEGLKPWDREVDPLGRGPLPAFDNPDELLDRCERAFRAISPEFGDCIHFMRVEGLFDVDARKHKAPAAYCRALEERRVPFVFCNTVPSRQTLTLFHECGHAFHYFLVREEPLLAYRHAPIEFEEVASTTMELLTGPYLGVMYEDPNDARRAYRNVLLRVATDIPRIAMVDAFQHWLYTHSNPTADARRQEWVALYQRFHRDTIDWSGYENVLAAWHTQGGGAAIVLRPFYYVEYGISLLAALQLWQRAIRGDMRGAVSSYRAGLSLGGSRPLPELFEAAGLRFAFGEETVGPQAAALGEALDAMPEEPRTCCLRDPATHPT